MAKPATGHKNCRGSELSRGPSDAVGEPVLIASVAVAFPLESKVMELGLMEQVADCTGCTEQESATGLSNELRWTRVTVEVEL